MKTSTPELVARLWDGKPNDMDRLDPSLVETLDRFKRAVDHVPEPDPDFLNRLWDDLLHASVRQYPSPGPLAPDVRPARHADFVTGTSKDTSDRGRWFSALAFAALLVLTLGVAFSQFGWKHDGPSGLGDPVIQAPGTLSPDDGAPGTTLGEILVPATELGDPTVATDRLTLLLNQVRMPPAMSGAWRSAVTAPRPGRELNAVISGTFTVVAQEEVEVIRAGTDTAESVPSGSEITLSAGDVLIHTLTMEAIWTTGATEVAMLSGYVVGMPANIVMPAPEWELLDYESLDRAGPVPAGTVRLQLREVTIEPEEKIAFAPEIIKVAMVKAGSSGFIGSGSDGSISLKGTKEPATVYLFLVEPGASHATPNP
jgi:hypothetical protein